MVLPSEWLNHEWITKVFVEQPLALPGSVSYHSQLKENTFLILESFSHMIFAVNKKNTVQALGHN